MKIEIISGSESEADEIFYMTKDILDETGVEAELLKIINENEPDLPIFRIGGKNIVSGRVPDKSEIKTYILIKSCRYCYGNE